MLQKRVDDFLTYIILQRCNSSSRLSNYAVRSDVEKTAGADTPNFPKKIELI